MNRANSDVFLSDEDLDLQELTPAELVAVYQAWLVAAAATDEDDAHLYSHGVFLVEPGFAHLVPQYAHLRPPPADDPGDPSLPGVRSEGGRPQSPAQT